MCVTKFEMDAASLMLPVIGDLLKHHDELRKCPTKLSDTLIAPHALVLTKKPARCTELFNVGKQATRSKLQSCAH